LYCDPVIEQTRLMKKIDKRMKLAPETIRALDQVRLAQEPVIGGISKSIPIFGVAANVAAC
jgi:hypothetical protein